MARTREAATEVEQVRRFGRGHARPTCRCTRPVEADPHPLGDALIPPARRSARRPFAGSSHLARAGCSWGLLVMLSSSILSCVTSGSSVRSSSRSFTHPGGGRAVDRQRRGQIGHSLWSAGGQFDEDAVLGEGHVLGNSGQGARRDPDQCSAGTQHRVDELIAVGLRGARVRRCGWQWHQLHYAMVVGLVIPSTAEWSARRPPQGRVRRR